jgi:hypothetical protein
MLQHSMDIPQCDLLINIATKMARDKISPYVILSCTWQKFHVLYSHNAYNFTHIFYANYMLTGILSGVKV